ncbi:kelch-like protein 17 [Melanaphis sacchari]|uniref:Kelch-like protein 17 n=1 Tax=Melanaphis sacchari TaxID=742174 RepID=A0A2H8TVC1_9HEMI|nr:kelch-like protein 17 [Melanaphis sacchari]
MSVVSMDYSKFEQCQHYHSSFTKLNELLKEETSCDIILKTTNGNEIHAHKYVLSSCSEYFERMFIGGFVESTKDIIHIKDIDYKILKYLVDYMYTGKLIKITKNNVEAILNGADIFQIKKVQRRCVKFLSKTLRDDNCLMIKNIADLRLITDLSDYCLKYTLKNFLFISEHISFMGIDITYLKQLLESDDLSAKYEEDVYEVVIKWVKHDENDRKHSLPELLNLVRLALIQEHILEQEIKSEPLIYSNPECLKIVTKVIDHFNFKNGDSLSKIIKNVKPRIDSKKFRNKFRNRSEVVCKIPDSEHRSAINLLAYFDNRVSNNTDISKVEWDKKMNEINFLENWNEKWEDLCSTDEESDDD